jgi:hypothetical protein
VRFTDDEELMVNKKASERVKEWQDSDILPDSHSPHLMQVGRQILNGGRVDYRTIGVPAPVMTSEHLVKQAEELKTQEDRLRAEFPAATKAMDPNDEANSMGSGCSVPVNQHGSEESVVLVDKSECLTPKTSEDMAQEAEQIERGTTGASSSPVVGTEVRRT